MIVNSDIQRELKGSKEFMDENERLISCAIKYVNKVLISIDKDKTQCETLGYLADEFGTNYNLFLLMVGIRITSQSLKFLYAKNMA